ncbi:MAG TPA: transglutaminaseTgpA domain-containing protein [Acidimicrobiales bacterium]|nr:transglutaminaseTgpA domain-containing protein [Acidimicrobiales bacterium]
MRRVVRAGLAPAALAAAIAVMFQRAFPIDELVRAAAVAVVAGGAAGALLGARRVPRSLAAIGAVALAAGGAAAITGGSLAPDSVPDAFALFLTVGLPAEGLRDLALVPYTLLLAAMIGSVAASIRGRTLPTLAIPTVALGVAAALVASIGFEWWTPALFAAAAGSVLLLDARNDLSQLPPLVGSNTELRRQIAWWRPLVQFVPALVLVAALAAALPHGRTIDLRRYVDPPTERFADLNPLAVAARASRGADDPSEIGSVKVNGAAPGRLRMAVLDRYDGTGWKQSAEFAITGRTLADDPLYPVIAAGSPPGDDSSLDDLTTVTYRPLGNPPLRAVPTAGVPRRVDDPDAVRYAPRAGILLAEGEATVSYTTAAAIAPPAETTRGDATVGSFPPELATCPASDRVAAIASELAVGTTTAVERLDRIENYLKVRRVYDPSAPGGQTLRSVERFLDQDYARGNLEAFVTSYALLARCAGVPVRVVVGLPEPAPGETRFTDRDVTAWVETPLARARWVPFDPLPTPEEQLQQAQLARQTPPPPPEPEPEPQTVPPRQVAPVDVSDESEAAVTWLALALLVLVVVLSLAWALVVPRLILRRRRRAADPSVAVHAAWATATDALIDHGIDVDSQHTPLEVARISAGRVPVVVPRLLEGLAPVVDRTRYSGEPASPQEAALAWGYVDAILDRLPTTRRIALARAMAPLRQPRLVVARLRTVVGLATGKTRWTAALPETALVATGSAPDDVPSVTIASRIGEGSTGSVFRGVLAPDNTPVAVKVFRYGPRDAGFDEHRFEWEVRIARQVSGLPHLPVVHDAGITPVTNRPYIVTSLYDGGTLLDRVRRGGPMTQAEVVAIGSDLAFALTALHQVGVVHADVKPENVFFGGDGWVLGDLGSAWLRAARGPAATMTPPYAAPEVWRGASPTPASDLYSLALTMLFAVTGQVPTASITPARDDVVQAFPDHPVMVRALEPDARRRPRSVAEFARQLQPDLVPAGRTDRLATLSLPTPTASYRRGN